MNFQSLTLTIALVILIISLLIVAYLIHSSKKNMRFPPTIGSCPDYWQETPDGGCVNIYNLGKNAPKTMIFSGASYVGTQGIQSKCDWARKHEITWDGVTNNPICS